MKKLLLIRFSALGDVAMLAPVVKEAATALPDIEFTVLSKPFCAPLFQGLAPNVRFRGADIKGDYHGISGLGRLYHELKAEHYDYVADMHGVLRTHYLTLRLCLSGHKVARINKRRAERRALTASGEKKRMRQLCTSFDKYREVLRALPIPGKERLDSLQGRGGQKGSVISFDNVDTKVCRMLAMAPDGARRIGIAPFAAHKGKIYPLEKMEQVIETITAEDSSAHIYLFGGGGAERDMMMRWQQRWQGRVTAASPALGSMSSELQLMSRLDVMLSMDSANMHLASLVGTRVVSLWGATHPYAGFLGWGQSLSDCVQIPLDCRPCSIFGNKPCHRGDFACMNGITPRSIAGVVMSY